MTETVPKSDPNPTAPATPLSVVEAGRPRLITVASGKGGVGKTWFAITLAQALARHGQRTVLFDGDLGLANVDIQLGLTPGRDLGSVIAGRASLAEAAAPYLPGGFDIIAGKSGSGALASLGRPRLMALRDELRQLGQSYDRVVVDLGAGIDSAVTVLGGVGGVVLTVITEEPTSLTDAYAFVKVMAMQNEAADLRIVVNMAQDRRSGERAYNSLKRAAESFLHLSPPLAGIIHRDPRVSDAIRRQMPLLTRHPMADAAQDVERIAKRLTMG